MSLTAIVWAILYSGAVVFSFTNPLWGALGYLLEYYMRPDLKWWGDALPALRYNLIISVVLGLTFFLRRGSLPQLKSAPNLTLGWLLALAGVMLFETLTVAVNAALSWEWMVQWVKIAIIFPLLLVGVVRTRKAFNAFIVAHMLGAFWWGWDAWMRPSRSAGRLLEIGSGDTFNDNAASAHLLTVLPFVIVYLLIEKDKKLRALALLAAPFVANTLILCNSRGSMVGLLAAAAAAFFLVRSGYRLRIVGAAVGFLAIGLALADDAFIRRQQTTTNYEQDGSAQQRLISWKAGFRLILDRPLGAGGRGFHLLSPIYIPEIVESHRGDLRAPHNTWVMVPSEWGVLGLICFIGIYASSFVMLERVKRRAGDPDQAFYYWRAFAIQLAIVGFLVAGTFTDRLYGEAGYWMVGLSYVLYRVQLTELAEATVRAKTAEPVTADALLTWPLADARPQ